jgi:hypothetical protein
MSAQEEPQAATGLVGVLDRLARGLDGQPALQAAIGGGILVVVLAAAVGGIAADQLWLFVAALVVLVLAGLVAWAIARRPEGSKSRSELSVGEAALIEDEGEVLQDRGAPPGRVEKKIKIGGGLTVRGKGKLGGGSYSGSSERQPEAPPARDPRS